ncbi:MAG: erythromycin esterase family protein [Chloroflexi bacterium]|nr:MAG: erythromycin esterase family protein [Chloroflexota bacterium]
MHGVEAFPQLRNQAFQHLVEHDGYRSIAIETDCLAALTVDAFVADGEGELDEVMRSGFSHGFEKASANRELVAWMRQYNRSRDASDRLSFYGFDAPMEMTAAKSPRPALRVLQAYLATNLEAALLPATAGAIDTLAGADERWSNPTAILDPSQSVGASEEASRLRVLVDDLLALLIAESPRLIASTSRDEWWRAHLHARTATGLLRYHAAMADASDARLARLLGLRDVMMADNVTAVLTREGQRGPTLMFGHNLHLQTGRSKWHLGDLSLEWWSVGSIIGAQLGDQYAVLSSALGAAPHQGLNAPAPDTLEGILSALPESRYLFKSRSLTAALSRTAPNLVLRTDAAPNNGYFPLDPHQLKEADGVIFVRDV